MDHLLEQRSEVFIAPTPSCGANKGPKHILIRHDVEGLCGPRGGRTGSKGHQSIASKLTFQSSKSC